MSLEISFQLQEFQLRKMEDKKFVCSNVHLEDLAPTSSPQSPHLKSSKEIRIYLERLFRAFADDRVYARFLQERRAAPMYAGVGVYDGDDAAGDACRYECIGARRGLAVMGTGL